MNFHTAANIFPLDDEHLDDLAEDIKKHGLLCPIETMDGKILDGRRRWLACQQAAVEPDFLEVDEDDPVAYVLSLNLHRRHLTASQRSMVAGRARERYDDEAKERQKRKPKDSVPETLPEQTGRSRPRRPGRRTGTTSDEQDRSRLGRRPGRDE